MYLKMNEGKLSLVSIFLPDKSSDFQAKILDFDKFLISYFMSFPMLQDFFLIFICISSCKSMIQKSSVSHRFIQSAR